MRRSVIAGKLVLFAALSFGALACAGAETNTPAPAASAAAPSARPAKWAVKLDRPHLSNFYQVTTNLYRGRQPDAQGMAELKAMGVKTVVNLRNFHSDDDEARGLGLKLQRLRMKPWHSEEEDVVAFLRIAANTNNYPIFVHCLRGADRTGLVCAMYRIVFCNWTRPEAIQEMKEGGFDFDPRWKNIVKYIEQADLEALKRKAGITSAKKPSER